MATIVNFSRKILSPTDYPVLLAGTARDKNIMAIMRDTFRHLHGDLTHNGTSEDFHYVDLAKLLSQVNRRSYRQGMVYHIANIVFDDAQGDATINVGVVPNTWTAQAAWKLGFEHWREQQRAAMKSIGHKDLGRWSDFKIPINHDMRGDADQFEVIDIEGNTFGVGDWTYSKYIIPDDGSDDPNSCDIEMMGPSVGSFPARSRVSLLQELEYALQKPQEDPDLATDVDKSVYALLSADQPDTLVLQDVLQDIETDNDMPPYDHDKVQGAGTPGTNIPAEPWVARTCMIKGGAGTASPVAAVGGFAAPLGLLCIETGSSVDGNVIGMNIELVPGEYKGVHAYPMRGGGF